MSRIRVGVLLGGGSGERPISLASGSMIAEHLPRERYEPVLLDPLALMAGNPRLSPELRERARALREGRRLPERLPEGELPEEFRRQIEAVAATAGPAAEALASALAMDKAMAKVVLGARGIPVPRDAEVARHDWREAPDACLERAAPLLPAVVKPVRQGSSLGMSLADDPAGLRAALDEALRHDDRALVEERLRGVELSVGVLGNRELQALPVIEIVPRRAFFDYKAKYDASLCEEICPARISEALAAEASDLALRAHRALGCRGLSRTDMIADASSGLRVLEVNTMPGMTVNSLLPKAAKVAGIPFPELLDRLVQLALEPAD